MSHYEISSSIEYLVVQDQFLNINTTLQSTFISDNKFVYFSLLDVLEVIAPFKQFSKLRDFMQSKLPTGFPVKIGKLSASCAFSLVFSLLNKIILNVSPILPDKVHIIINKTCCYI